MFGGRTDGLETDSVTTVAARKFLGWCVCRNICDAAIEHRF